MGIFGNMPICICPFFSNFINMPICNMPIIWKKWAYINFKICPKKKPMGGGGGMFDTKGTVMQRAYPNFVNIGGALKGGSQASIFLSLPFYLQRRVTSKAKQGGYEVKKCTALRGKPCSVDNFVSSFLQIVREIEILPMMKA